VGKDLAWGLAKDDSGVTNVYCLACKTKGVFAHIGKYKVNGVFRYIAWHNNKNIGVFDTADEAKNAIGNKA
jgi:hypothetical protein